MDARGEPNGKVKNSIFTIFFDFGIPVIPFEIKPSLIRTYQKTVETLIKVALVDIITEWE